MKHQICLQFCWTESQQNQIDFNEYKIIHSLTHNTLE